MNNATTAPAYLTTKTLTLHFGPEVNLRAPAGTSACPRLYAAFELVNPEVWGRSDWREEVSAVLHPKDLEAAGLTIEDVLLAVVFYTATQPTHREIEINAEPGVFAHVVKADGYRRGPAC